MEKKNPKLKIPEWQYPLYKKTDKVVYLLLKKLGRTGKYPELKGSKEEINEFLKLLIITQKTKKYREYRDIVLKEFRKEVVAIPKLVIQGKKIKIPRGIDKSWAILTQDKRICELVDQFADSKIKFLGTDKQVVEFVVRFFLSQLLQDWRGPKMAILSECLKAKTIKLSKLNRLLQVWDYTNIFK